MENSKLFTSFFVTFRFFFAIKQNVKFQRCNCMHITNEGQWKFGPLRGEHGALCLLKQHLISIVLSSYSFTLLMLPNDKFLSHLRRSVATLHWHSRVFILFRCIGCCARDLLKLKFNLKLCDSHISKMRMKNVGNCRAKWNC